MKRSPYKIKLMVVGGGFSGLTLIEKLKGNSHFEITLIDRNNYNYFPPLLYQVATGFLDPASISYPFRKLFRSSDIRFRIGSVTSIDPNSQTLWLDQGDELEYDILVLAAGAHTNFYGNKNIEHYSTPMKTIDDALKMRNKLLGLFERAAVAKTEEERKRLLNVVIAGGGPTGVEVAGMLAEMKQNVLRKDYPELRNDLGTVYLVEGAPNLLQPMTDRTHSKVLQIMRKLKVHVYLNTLVSDFNGKEIILNSGEKIAAETLIWAAGISANLFQGIPNEVLGKGNRIQVNGINHVPGIPNVFALGDMSIQTSDGHYPFGHPQVAQVAIQQATHLGNNLKRLAKGDAMRDFVYQPKGDLAIIGRSNAVADLISGKLHLHGLAALFIWLFVHLRGLVQYRNKVVTLYHWGVAYLTNDISLRMVFNDNQVKSSSAKETVDTL